MRVARWQKELLDAYLTAACHELAGDDGDVRVRVQQYADDVTLAAFGPPRLPAWPGIFEPI